VSGNRQPITDNR